jgi:hypothetical protein
MVLRLLKALRKASRRSWSPSSVFKPMRAPSAAPSISPTVPRGVPQCLHMTINESVWSLGTMNALTPHVAQRIATFGAFELFTIADTEVAAIRAGELPETFESDDVRRLHAAIETNCKPRTQENYRSRWNVHLKPFFGSMLAAQVTRDTVTATCTAA